MNRWPTIVSAPTAIPTPTASKAALDHDRTRRGGPAAASGTPPQPCETMSSAFTWAEKPFACPLKASKRRGRATFVRRPWYGFAPPAARWRLGALARRCRPQRRVPVSGLEVFGPGDERARLQGVARDGAFREAVTWQSREVLASAVDKVAGGVVESPARRRRREDAVASDWQRYCAKNDTIGFFGPLAWGRFAEEGVAVDVRAGGLARECVVHLEVWAVEALARAVGLETVLPMGPLSATCATVLSATPITEARERGLAALDRLEAARRAVADAGRDGLLAALVALDRLFEELAGRPAVWAEGDSDGGRTVAYLDCMRDLDVTLGPGVLAELRATLPALLASSRWWCGVVYAAGKARLEQVARPTGPGRLRR